MKQLRIVLIFFLTLFLPTTLLAKGHHHHKKTKTTHVVATSPWWHSFYVSLGLGSELLQSTQAGSSAYNINAGGGAIVLQYSGQDTANIQGNSVLGHLGIGFAIARGSYYLGIEPYLEVSNLSGNTQSTAVVSGLSTLIPDFANRTQVRLSSLSGGIDFKPGILITPQLNVFAIIGGNIRRVKVTSSSTFTDELGVFGLLGTPNFDATSTTSHTEFAARFGFGLQSWINRHWAMTLNFIHNFYPNRSESAQRSLTSPLGSAITSSTASNLTDISSNLLMIGANYYFTPLDPKTAWLSAPTNVQWQGLFAGIATGASILQAIENTRQSSNVTSSTTVASEANSELDTGNVGSETSFFVGFGHLFRQRFYVAVRGFASWANRDLEGKTVNSSTQFTVGPLNGIGTINHNANVELRNIEWGADLLPGYLITPQMLVHLTIGFAGNKATLASTTSEQVSLGLAVLNTALTGTTTKSLYGLRLGIGLQQAITNKVRLTADYVYTDYGHISINDTAATPIGSLNNSSSFNLHSQAVLVGILLQV